MLLFNKIDLNTKRDYIVLIIGILAFIYLLNPTLGIFEFVPDNIPFMGNIDEGAAMFLIFATFKYFGYDFRDIFKKESKQSAPLELKEEPK